MESDFTPQDSERLFAVKIREELDGYYEEICRYHEMEPDQVLISVSGLSARLIAIRAELQRSGSQRANRLRTSEVDPLLAHLELQSRLHSRLVSVRTLDWDMTKGAPA